MADEEEPYILYHFPFSLCSMMARLTYGWRGSPSPGQEDMKIEPKVVDIAQKLEQFSEEFLCEINPRGKVPVLYHKTRLPTPMSESVDISYYICARYLDLLPAEHADEIKSYVQRLHGISFYALTYETRPQHPEAMRQSLLALMNLPGISERYRTALEKKIEMNDIEKVQGLQGSSVAENVALTSALFADLEKVFQDHHPTDSGSEGIFIYGPKSTVLDCHLLPFLIRMDDVGRGHLIPAQLNRYMQTLRVQDAWREITPSLKTVPTFR